MTTCNPETGVCELPEANQPVPSQQAQFGKTQNEIRVHYVGDPMCSWCWGISPTVEAVAAYCADNDVGFTLTVGGLRAGGGDLWNTSFKNFLRHEWQKIAQVTGQPFGFTLLDAAHFEYDTEPACRAVVVAQMLQSRKQLPARLPLQFFAAIQRKFYVAGADTKSIDFYAELCGPLGFDFAEFAALFNSQEAWQATQAAFARCRGWGVRSFPTLLLEQKGQLGLLASGFVTKDAVLQKLTQARQATA
jgi:putative protein-disulfide isomerase